VSPKSQSTWIQKTGNELKLIYPQEDLNPERIKAEGFDYYFLQAMDCQNLQKNIADAINFCKRNRNPLNVDRTKTNNIAKEL
jgi:hypothetical protein